MRLIPNRRDRNVKTAAADGKAAARADRKAGGFANACDGTGHVISCEADVMTCLAGVLADPSQWRDVVGCYAPSWRWGEFDELLTALGARPLSDLG